jgi:transcriptional regulator of acetoin/glycerol metabolism
MPRRRPDRTTLRHARDLLLERGEIPLCDAVTPLIARSWKRSLDAGVSPHGKLTDVRRLDDAEFVRAREQRSELLSFARPIMNYLLRASRDAGGIVILADERAFVLEAMGDADFLTRAERVALAPGASWNERYRGTNGVGTSLVEGHSVVVCGAEHFLNRNSFLSCTSVPVLGPDGTTLGAVNVSLTERMHHPHTLGLVEGAARIMEIKIFLAHHSRNLRLRLHPDAAGLGTFAEGIVALTDGGKLVGANQAGLAYLGLRAEDLRTIVSIETLLPIRLSDLIDWSRQRPGEPMLVTLPDNERLFMRVDVPAPTVPRGQPPLERRAKPRDALDDLRTGDEQIAAAIDKARKLLIKPIPILLHGEPGVGKKRFARALHDSGSRRTGPFVVLNCAGVGSGEIDAELFGRISLDGCDAVAGAMREADGGTLFLDGIESLPRRVQLCLLGALNNKRIVPIGSGTSVSADFHLISSTNCDLKSALEDGTFGPDLYYLLVGFTLHLPPLRIRQDLPALISREIEDLAPSKGICLDAAVSTAFAEYSWPGNLRQLRNVLAAACLLLDEGETRIVWKHLPCDLLHELRGRALSRAVNENCPAESLREQSLLTMERTLALCGGNYSEAARRLGISRATLYRKIRRPGAH